MAEVNYKDSYYRYTDPPRYFKANDPYYWEVDNIPLKQIHENTLWLKDQISGASISQIKRADLDELKPYVNGQDNIVYVKSGRYTARINDVSNIKRLQQLTKELGFGIGTMDVWQALALNEIDGIEGFKSKSLPLFMNGLMERAFTYPVKDTDYAAINYLSVAGPTTTGVVGLKKPIFPVSEILNWANLPSNYSVYSNNFQSVAEGFLPLANAENHFMKMWRGVARTAIVDVPQELYIEVPPFDTENDYFYTDENGQKQRVAGDPSSRIDLLFIYSKSIDVSGSTINKFVNNVATTITTPTLGLLRGAGLGVDFSSKSSTQQYGPTEGISSDGTLKMIPNAGDTSATNTGFTGVKGSFPAPDDLLNIAPLLVESLESTAYPLIGQSILPIAYIVVKNDASVNSGGQKVISSSDVIDIRPFFRTTELSYNERSGIAGAVPQISLANPVVGKAAMDWEIKRVFDLFVSELAKLQNSKVTTPRTIGSGYLFGGANFGVEGTYMDYLEKEGVGTFSSNKELLRNEVLTRMGIHESVFIPDYPDWDIAEWCQGSTYNSPGLYPNDRVNYSVVRGTAEGVAFGCRETYDLGTKLSGFGTDNIQGNDNHVSMLFCKKTIKLDRTKVDWIQDYIVNVNYLNCIPLSCRSFGASQDGFAGGSGIWVEKKKDEFTIYCTWVANDIFPARTTGSTKNKLVPGGSVQETWPSNNREGRWYAGFAVLINDIMVGKDSTRAFTGESAIGAAIYPSIMFNVIGIPKNFGGYEGRLNAENAILKLV